MLGSEYIDIWARVTAVVVPVAVYFLLLGLLNSRRHPQLLTGRRDFALLVVALGPLFVLPALAALGPSLGSAALVVAAMATAVLLLAPGRGSWVVYNVPSAQGREAVARALGRLGLPAEPFAGGFRLGENGPVVQISDFPLLRNVTVRLRGGGPELARRFESALGGVLAEVHAETSPMAVSLLLVATAMLVTPLGMVAHRAGEIVRLLTGLLP